LGFSLVDEEGQEELKFRALSSLNLAEGNSLRTLTVWSDSDWFTPDGTLQHLASNRATHHKQSYPTGGAVKDVGAFTAASSRLLGLGIFIRLLQLLEFRLQRAHIHRFGALLEDVVGFAARGWRLQLQRVALRTDKV